MRNKIKGTNFTAGPNKNLHHLNEYEGTKKSDEVKIYLAFSEPHTMLEVSRLLSIERASICWAVDKLRRTKALFYCGARQCLISGHTAGTYCTKEQREVAL